MGQKGEAQCPRRHPIRVQSMARTRIGSATSADEMHTRKQSAWGCIEELQGNVPSHVLQRTILADTERIRGSISSEHSMHRLPQYWRHFLG
jgi:hypothetical protein